MPAQTCTPAKPPASYFTTKLYFKRHNNFKCEKHYFFHNFTDLLLVLHPASGLLVLLFILGEPCQPEHLALQFTCTLLIKHELVRGEVRQNWFHIHYKCVLDRQKYDSEVVPVDTFYGLCQQSVELDNERFCYDIIYWSRK